MYAITRNKKQIVGESDVGNRNLITQLRRQDKGKRENNTYTKQTLEILTKLTEYKDTDTDNCRVVYWIHL